MSFYTFAATNLTTPDDLKRRPAIDRGQLVRTLILSILFILALAMMGHRSEAAAHQVQADRVL